jgi:hypothetical protein
MRPMAFAGLVAVAVGACSALQPAALYPPPSPYPTAYPPPSPYPTAYPPPSPYPTAYPHPPPIYAQVKCQGPGGYNIQDDLWVREPKPEDIAGGGWEVCPGKVLMPATFCGWAPSALPPAQLKTCYAQKRKADPAAYKANWKILKADNGAAYEIDLNSIRSFPPPSYGAPDRAEAVIYIVEGDDFNPMNMKRMLFDCRGHMTDISGGNGMPTMYLPPLSVGAQLSAIACARVASEKQ